MKLKVASGVCFFILCTAQAVLARTTHILVIKEGHDKQDCVQKIQNTKLKIEDFILDGKLVYVDLLSEIEKLDCIQSIEENKPVYLR